MNIVVISDGKYGERAFASIKEIFPQTNFVILPEYDKAQILDSVDFPPDPLAAIKAADLLVNYHRHPDIAYELASFKVPMIQAVYNGEGFLRQIRQTHGRHVIMPSSMCSLETGENAGSDSLQVDDPAKAVFREFGRYFGAPAYRVQMRGDSNIIENVTIERGSPCGATTEAVAALQGKELNAANLNAFAMQVRQMCRESLSYIIQRTGVEENAIINHLDPLVRALAKQRPDLFKPGGSLAKFLTGMPNNP